MCSYESYNPINHKNYNFLAIDWLRKVLFSTNSLAKLLSESLLLDSLLLDSLLSDSSMSQSHSKMSFKSTNHIQSCNFVLRARALAVVFLQVALRPWQTRTHCYRHKCFPVCPRATFVADTKNVSETFCVRKKCSQSA